MNLSGVTFLPERITLELTSIKNKNGLLKTQFCLRKMVNVEFPRNIVWFLVCLMDL